MTRTDTRPTLVYARESRDAKGEHYERIETQRDILLDFCKKQGIVNIVDVVMDDDVSGTSFKRLSGVLDRVQNGEVEVLVFKDASRLGRNLRESLNFVHMMERYGAEILFESEAYDEDFFPLKAWFNEQRAKDDSVKIRRVLRHKMEAGTLCVRPTYGYRKGPENEVLVDSETAPVVQEIFKMCLDGTGTRDIASELNQRGLPTPSQVARRKTAREIWCCQHIRRILRNDIYTGTMTYGKLTVLSYKNKKVVSQEPKDWVVLENHHEPLVSKEVFDATQALISGGQYVRYNASRPFSGLLECGKCGRNLVIILRKDRVASYICGKNHEEGGPKEHIRPNYGCETHNVSEAHLYTIAISYIRTLISGADVSSTIRQDTLGDGMAERIAELQTRIHSAKKTLSQVYDDKLSGLIGEELFQTKYREHMELISRYEQQTSALKARMPQQRPQADKVDLQFIMDGLSEKTVTASQLRQIFERIIYYLPGEISEEAKDKYGLTDENFAFLHTNGGLLFLEKTCPSITIMAQS